jgi:hypothetical protein
VKIKKYIRLQLVGWSIYWLLLLTINILFFKNKDYDTPLLILWTILFTISGLFVFFFLTRFYTWLIKKNIDTTLTVTFIIILSFIGAYTWGLFEPIISWIINPKISQLDISWDINSRRTFPFTFVVAFFSILYYFSKLLEQSNTQKEIRSINNEENSNLNDTIAVYFKNDIVLLPYKNIVKISINGNYSTVVDNNNIKYQLKKALVKWENDLPKFTFLRIHRSTIINKHYIEKIEPWHNYTYRIKLNNSDIPEEVSRRCAIRIRKEVNL